MCFIWLLVDCHAISNDSKVAPQHDSKPFQQLQMGQFRNRMCPQYAVNSNHDLCENVHNSTMNKSVSKLFVSHWIGQCETKSWKQELGSVKSGHEERTDSEQFVPYWVEASRQAGRQAGSRQAGMQAGRCNSIWFISGIAKYLKTWNCIIILFSYAFKMSLSFANS